MNVPRHTAIRVHHFFSIGSGSSHRLWPSAATFSVWAMLGGGTLFSAAAWSPAPD